MSPAVSVIVTTYNRPELLKETVLSILSQTFSDLELIIVDNNSNYNFEKLVESFGDTRIRGYQNSNNGIIAINRNYGIKLATGKYIAFCDDDDLWEPSKLEEQVSVMKKFPSIGVCSTDISFINGDYKKFGIAKVITSLKDKVLSLNIIPAKYLLIFAYFVVNSSVLFKRELVDSIGYINEDPHLKTIEDYEYWFRLSRDNKFYYLSRKLVRYRLHDEQLSTVDSKTIYKRSLQIVKKNWPDLNLLQRIICNIQSFKHMK